MNREDNRYVVTETEIRHLEHTIQEMRRRKGTKKQISTEFELNQFLQDKALKGLFYTNPFFNLFVEEMYRGMKLENILDTVAYLCKKIEELEDELFDLRMEGGIK